MAECGRDIDPLLPATTEDGDDDAGFSNPFSHADLTVSDEANELHKFTSTSSRRESAAETSFMGASSKLRILENKKDETEYELKKIYSNADPSAVRINEFRRLHVSLVKGKGVEFTFLQ